MTKSEILLSVLAGLVVVGSLMSPALAAAENGADKQLSVAEKKARQEKWFGAKTIVAAKKAASAQFKDPNSAQFKDVYANYTDAYDVVACGYVNAKNSFGAYTGYKAFVSSGKSVILEGRDNIKAAWRDACVR